MSKDSVSKDIIGLQRESFMHSDVETSPVNKKTNYGQWVGVGLEGGISGREKGGGMLGQRQAKGGDSPQ